MKKAILITRPNHDLVTTYLFHWSKYVIDVANKKDIKVLDLSSKKANRKTFTSYIIKNEPLFVFFNGHGNKNVITGYDNEPLILAGKNEQLLEKKIVYARSCDAGKNLAQFCIKNKTLAFIGYKKKYTICYSSSSTNYPLQDDIAKLFITPSNLVPISFLKGNSAKEVYRKSQESMLRNFSYMLSTRATKSQKDAAPYLWFNKKYQILLGDPNVRM